MQLKLTLLLPVLPVQELAIPEVVHTEIVVLVEVTQSGLSGGQ
jgi:hypothetical protein